MSGNGRIQAAVDRESESLRGYNLHLGELVRVSPETIKAELEQIREFYSDQFVFTLGSAMVAGFEFWDEGLSGYESDLRKALGENLQKGPFPPYFSTLHFEYHPEAVINRLKELKETEGPVPKPKKRKARPSKKALQGALAASLAGTMTDEHRHVLEAASTSTRREMWTRTTLRGMVESDPWERDRAWISDALAQCPLPLTKLTGAEANKVIREVRTGSGPLTVVYTATGLQSIPYGKDAYLLDVLISEARKRGERLVSFETAIEIMRMAGFDVGGRDYRLFKDALERIGGLHISVIRRGVGKGNYRVVQIQNLDIPSQEDVRRELSGQKRMIQYAFEFSEEFYGDFMKYYTVIPQDILDAFAGAPTEYAIARWLYRRVTKAQSSAYIPLEEVHQEIAPSDTNDRRFRAKFEKVLMTMQEHWPELHQALKPKRLRRKGSEVMVGVHLHGPIPALIGDRKVSTNGKVGTDLEG